MMFAAFDSPTILALLGIVVLWFSLKRFGRRASKSSTAFPVSRPASPATSTDGHHLDAPTSVARWEVAMHETARDLMGRLDSKIVIVEQLVRDAGLAAARLEAVLQRIEQSDGRQPRPESAAPSSMANSEPPTAGAVPKVDGSNAVDA